MISPSMRIPEPLAAVLDELAKIGRPRLVGGAVRDWLLGGEPKDFDVEILGVSFDQLQNALAPFGPTDVVGRSFGVVKLRRGDDEYDFSLPRRESKTGAGHRGFAVEADPGLSDAEAAARRDFTINAIAYDPVNGALIDPHGGEADLRARILRHTSPAFAEDPLRVLRGFQLAARFDFSLAPETVELCRQIVDTYAELPLERVWGEWAKWAEKSIKPSSGLRVLEETGWLKHFPEIAALRGTPQDPEWHPEGDVFTHTSHCLDALCRAPEWREAEPATRRILSFAVLAHDFGKPTTTVFGERRGQMRWLSPGHEAAGVPSAEKFLERIGSPLQLIEYVRPLVANHLAHHQSGSSEFTDTAVRRLARRLQPASIELLGVVMRADHEGRPPLRPDEAARRIETLQACARALALEQQGPRPLLLGRHLIQQGLQPGPKFKLLLDDAFEAQLNGAFHNETEATIWLQNHLRQRESGLT